MSKGQYKQWCTEDGRTLLKGWKRSGMTNEEIADKIGINVSTLYEWQSKYLEIADALKKGKQLCDFEAEEALLGLFEGHYVENTVTEIIESPTGEQKKHIKKTKQWIAPQAAAIMFYLKCRAGWDERAVETARKAELGELAYKMMMQECNGDDNTGNKKEIVSEKNKK